MSFIQTASPPALSLEVKGHILRFCDPATLAVASRVSLAFLELASPVLYQDIRVHGINTLLLLLTSRGLVWDGTAEDDLPPSEPAVAVHLSLEQTRDLTVTILEHDIASPEHAVWVDDAKNQPRLRRLSLVLESDDVGLSDDLWQGLQPSHFVATGRNSSIDFRGLCWSDVESASFTRLSIAHTSFGETTQSWSSLTSVTFDLRGTGRIEASQAVVVSLGQDFPFEPRITVTCLVRSAEDKQIVLDEILDQFEQVQVDEILEQLVFKVAA